jgi:hypothetical protein
MKETALMPLLSWCPTDAQRAMILTAAAFHCRLPIENKRKADHA